MLPRKTIAAIPTVNIIPPKKLHASNLLAKHEQLNTDMTVVEVLFSIDTEVFVSTVVLGVVVVLEFSVTVLFGVSVFMVIDALVGLELKDRIVDVLDVVMELL